MLEIGDKVITVTNDDCNGFTGAVRELWYDGYTVGLDEYPESQIGFWFGFDEVKRVEA